MKFSGPKKPIFALGIFNKTEEMEKKSTRFKLFIFHSDLTSYWKTNGVINRWVDRKKIWKDTVIKYNSQSVILFLSITDRPNY